MSGTNTDIDTSPYRLPAEWEPHQSTWLSYPHAADTWPGGIEKIFNPYNEFIQILSTGETVHINVQDTAAASRVKTALAEAGAVMENIVLHEVPTNDAWCRDHGPCFVVEKATHRKMIVNWGFNSWGEKYPYALDDQVPARVAAIRRLPWLTPC